MIKIDPNYYRPNEIYNLRGDYSKAKKILGWKPKTSFDSMIEEMVYADLKNTKVGAKYLLFNINELGKIPLKTQVFCNRFQRFPAGPANCSKRNGL